MLRIDDTLFSLDILTRKFACNLRHCRGICCREGDSGAPLLEEEVEILENIWPDVRPFLRPEGINAVTEQGTSLKDWENDHVTPLIDNLDCAYSVLGDDDILMCGIEKAWTEGKINFRKPLSCHLFPVRIKNYTGFTAMNYEEWPACSGGREKGRKEGIYLYEFLKEPLIRALGKEKYEKLLAAARELRKES